MVVPFKNEEYFDKWALDFNELPDEYSYHMQLIASEIKERLPKKKRLNILDLGTGSGRLLLALDLPHNTYVGVDISNEQLIKAEKRFRARSIPFSFKKCDLEGNLPINGNSIDVLVSNASFHHIKNKQKVLNESYRILKKEGKIIIFDFYFGELDPNYLLKVSSIYSKNPKLAEQFNNSIKKEHELMPPYLEQTHPNEFHISPTDLLN